MSKIYVDWLRQLTQPNFPPVMAIGGEERAFVEEALAEIKKRILNSGLTDFNLDVLSARSTSLESVIFAAKALPIMASHRLVLVTEAEAIKVDDVSLLEIYLTAPNPNTVLVFVFDQLDTRLKFQKLLESGAVVYQFDHPKEREMLTLIKSRGKLRGLHIEDEAALSLFLEVGNNLLMLERAFEKLELSHDGKAITVQKISEQITQTSYQDAFVLARAVVMKDRVQVAKSLCELKKAQEVPLRLLGVLAWQFRIILKARLLLDEKRSGSEIGSRLNLFGDRLDFVIRTARMLDTSAHINRLKALLDLDRALKSSRVPAWLNFDLAVLELS